MDYQSVTETIVRVLESVGVAAVVLGAAYSTVVGLVGWRRDDARTAYRDFRRNLGRSILVGLEFFVAADIIRTVAIEPTFENVGVLGLLILVRTVLSFALEVEIDGRWPWQRVKPGVPSEDEV